MAPATGAQGAPATAAGVDSAPATGSDAPGYVTRLDRTLGAACFSIVALAVVAGIVWIVVNG